MLWKLENFSLQGLQRGLSFSQKTKSQNDSFFRICVTEEVQSNQETDPRQADKIYLTADGHFQIYQKGKNRTAIKKKGCN